MIPLLYMVLFVEGAVALLLMVKIGPLRELAMRVIDQIKTGRGPATVKTLACTLSVILASSVASLLKIQSRGVKLGSVSPMDQVLWRTHLLEASLIGYTLFLAVVVDRFHHYMRKLIMLRKTASVFREEIEKLQALRDSSSNEGKRLQEEVSMLKEKLQKAKAEADEHERRATIAEAHVASLQKQSEELLLEYDRLLEDNQVLQTQALAFRG